MITEELFSLALGLVPPWLVDDVTFQVEERRLDLHINFPKGSRFACPVCGEECPEHDTREHTWRHMDFFQHEACLHARIPPAMCPEHGVHQIPVTWARQGSRLALLFEALIMTLVREMPEARTRVDMAHVHSVGVDETFDRRGHDYITLFVDLEARRLLFATPGKDATTFERFTTDLKAHGASEEAVTDVSMDLSPAFQKGAKEHLPSAQVTFDRFHLMKLVNKDVGALRRNEAFTQPDLKKTRWLWLKNEWKPKVKQKEKLQALLKDQHLKTAQAYQFRLTFHDIFTIKNRHQGATLLKAWLENTKASGQPPIIKVAYTIMNHWDGVLCWFESQISNGILEGFNSLIQSAKTKARGYRTHKTISTWLI